MQNLQFINMLNVFQHQLLYNQLDNWYSSSFESQTDVIP